MTDAGDQAIRALRELFKDLVPPAAALFLSALPDAVTFSAMFSRLHAHMARTYARLNRALVVISTRQSAYST